MDSVQTTYLPPPSYLTRMADGTVKQLNPFTGSQVWTVPGRANRPLGLPQVDPSPVAPEDLGRLCAFCEQRYLDTPPEKARLVRTGEAGDAGGLVLTGVGADEVYDTTAELRRVPNLFEILSYDYWHTNYGYEMPAAARERQAAYLATSAGREHVLAVLRSRWLASGRSESDWETTPLEDRLAESTSFFAGGHDVIVARRHLVDGATTDDQLASAGTLTPDEHHAYLAFTVDALRELYEANRYAPYVAVFQNWLKPAGASFDHLHKQLVTIDERGVQTELELSRLRANPNLYNEAAVNYAGYHNLVVAENEHAIAFAGFGHRYPTLEVFSKSEQSNPWDHSPAELRAMSDLVHACHAATGARVPTNEEWHHRPRDVDLPMPWRIMLKWRVSTLAGFEGGTKIYLNTIDPWSLRDRVVPRLLELRETGAIATDLAIGSEATCAPSSLRYNGRHDDVVTQTEP